MLALFFEKKHSLLKSIFGPSQPKQKLGLAAAIQQHFLATSKTLRHTSMKLLSFVFLLSLKHKPVRADGTQTLRRTLMRNRSNDHIVRDYDWHVIHFMVQETCCEAQWSGSVPSRLVVDVFASIC